MISWRWSYRLILLFVPPLAIIFCLYLFEVPKEELYWIVPSISALYIAVIGIFNSEIVAWFSKPKLTLVVYNPDGQCSVDIQDKYDSLPKQYQKAWYYTLKIINLSSVEAIKTRVRLIDCTITNSSAINNLGHLPAPLYFSWSATGENNEIYMDVKTSDVITFGRLTERCFKTLTNTDVLQFPGELRYPEKAIFKLEVSAENMKDSRVFCLELSWKKSTSSPDDPWEYMPKLDKPVCTIKSIICIFLKRLLSRYCTETIEE